MRGVYAIVDLGALDSVRVPPVDFVKAILEGGLGGLQLRAKRSDGKRVLALLREIAPMCKEYGVPLFANDRVDFALLSGCDGVHVGQSDLAPADVRQLGKKLDQPLLVGLSTHDEEQLVAALDLPVDYVAVGPIFGTVSKDAPDPVLGVERALAISAIARSRRPDLPLVAIGGINQARVAELAGGFDAVAVISAILPQRGQGPAQVTECVELLASYFPSKDSDDSDAGATAMSTGPAVPSPEESA